MGCNRRHAPAVARSRDWHLGQARLAIGHALNGARFALRMVGSPDGVPSLRTLQDVTRSVEMQARAARNALERAAPVDGDLYRVVHDAAWNLSYLMVCIDASDAGQEKQAPARESNPGCHRLAGRGGINRPNPARGSAPSAAGA